MSGSRTPQRRDWWGGVRGDDIDLPIDLQVDRGATWKVALGSKPPTQVKGLAWRGDAVVGTATFAVPADEVGLNRANQVSLKVLRCGAGIEGRVLASNEEPGRLATLPFAVSLSRV